ncbi:MAG: class I SAM-dependent methyltransferase [Aurantibacter sp.]
MEMSGDYYKTPESVEEYIKLAEGYNGKKLIEKLKRFLPSGSHLLELGSGPGTDWEILDANFNVVGSDNSDEFIKRLAAKHPNGEFHNLDAITITTDQKFDGIYSNKVLHHLTDSELESSIKKQYEVLHPQGIVCHSFWKGEGSEVFKGLFVNYHSIITIGNLLDNSFEVLVTESYKEFEDDDSILLIARKR